MVSEVVDACFRSGNLVFSKIEEVLRTGTELVVRVGAEKYDEGFL